MRKMNSKVYSCNSPCNTLIVTVICEIICGKENVYNTYKSLNVRIAVKFLTNYNVMYTR